MDDMQIPQNGIAIRCLRLKDGWTQKDLAAHVGVAGGTLSNIEAENDPASELVINRLARALKVPTGAITHRSVPWVRSTERAAARRASKVAA